MQNQDAALVGRLQAKLNQLGGQMFDHNRSLTWGLRPLVICVVVWICGLWLGEMAGASVGSWWWKGAGALAIWAIFWYCNWRGWSVWLLVACFCVGGAWSAWDRQYRELLAGADLEVYVGRQVLYQGVVLGEVLQRWERDDQELATARSTTTIARISSSLPSASLASEKKATRFQSMVISLEYVAEEINGHWLQTNSRIRLVVKGGLPFHRGERVLFRGRLRPPQYYANPGAFDWRVHALRQGVRFGVSCVAESVARLGLTAQQTWMRRVDDLRRRLGEWIDGAIKAEQAGGLVKALLLGDRSGVTPTMRENFARTGTSHLLAISGLHLAIVCTLVWGFGAYILSSVTSLLNGGLHRKLASLATIPMAICYTLLSGGAISTRRALVMISIFLLGSILWRSREVSTSLAVAAYLILLFDPTALYALSFQLSFSAVIALVICSKIVMRDTQTEETDHRAISIKWLLRLLSWFGLAAVSSLATISFTLPLTLYYFPHLPLWGPIVNVLAVPLGGFLVVGTGLLAICMWFISPMLAAYIIELSGLCARMLLALIDWFNSLPGADWSLAPMRTHEITAYYSLLLGLCLLRWRSYRRVTVLCLITAIVLWGGGWLWQEIRHWRGRPLEIHFIDVGQGDATLIKFPNGQNMLVDAGGSAFGKVDVGERALYPYLRWLRVNRIDFAVLSHPHPDHFDGFIYIARKIPIGEFWHNGQQIALPRFRVLMQTLQELRVRQRVFHRHQRIDIGGVQIQNLHPLPGPHEGTSYYWVFGGNDNSLVLHLQYKEVSFLLAGDIETRAEEILSERWPNLRVNLLKVPHHGSRTSSTDRLLDLLKPQHAALSLGRMNRYNFPHPSVIERYQQRHIKLWRTDQHGRLHVSTNGKTIQFSAYQQYQKMNH